MENKKRVFTILIIDDGGVRGKIPARILQEIEERTGKPIADLFDMVGGTSTGAIVGGGLLVPDPENPLKPRYSAKDMVFFYDKFAPKIFPEIKFKSLRQLSSSALYDAKPIEDILEKNFGNIRMKDLLTSFFIPATDIKNFKPIWIKYLKGQKDTSEEGWSSMLLRDAIRATTSAPTYFPARYYETVPNDETPEITHRHALIDGAFFGANTMRHLLTHAKKIAPPDAEIIVVQLGTGVPDISLSPDEYNSLGTMGLLNKSNGSILLSLIANIPTMDIGNDMRNEIGERFFSFDGDIERNNSADFPSYALDDASADNLEKLGKFAERIIRDNDANLTRLCSILNVRLLEEEKYLESHKALQALSDKMAECQTLNSLMRVYGKIVRYGSDLEDNKFKSGDEDILRLSEKLIESHKTDLDRIYRVMLDRKKHQSKIVNSIKEVGEDITRFTRKYIVEPFQTPANQNDEDPPVKRSNDKNSP
jgi:predicted acylesterase/phospholipase RssA